MLLPAAISRQDIANYVGALFDVYIAMILIYVLVNMLLSFGAKPPYSRAFDSVMSYLGEVSNPWLRIFRRFIPAFSGIDLSVTAALFALIILARVIPNAISG
jgi:YggT family protein